MRMLCDTHTHNSHGLHNRNGMDSYTCRLTKVNKPSLFTHRQTDRQLSFQAENMQNSTQKIDTRSKWKRSRARKTHEKFVEKPYRNFINTIVTKCYQIGIILFVCVICSAQTFSLRLSFGFAFVDFSSSLLFFNLILFDLNKLTD